MPKITPGEWNNLNDQATVEALLAVPTLDITVAAEGGDAIAVSAQLQDILGNDLSLETLLIAWVSDAAGGALTGTPPDSGVAVTDGLQLEELTAEKTFMLMTGTDGLCELTLSESGVATWYVNFAIPGGPRVSSAAVTFA